MRNDIVGYGDIICVFPVSYIKHVRNSGKVYLGMVMNSLLFDVNA